MRDDYDNDNQIFNSTPDLKYDLIHVVSGTAKMQIKLRGVTVLVLVFQYTCFDTQYFGTLVVILLDQFACL